MIDRAASRKARINLLRAALLPALATILVWTPQILASIPAISGIESGEEVEPVAPAILLFTLYFIAAPAIALIVNWRWPAATDRDRATYAGLPQVVVSPALVWFAVWLEVERGYLLRDSSEEAMSYGIGVTLAVVPGIILTILVAAFGRLGARLTQGGHDSRFDAEADSRVATSQDGQVRADTPQTPSKTTLAIALTSVGALVVLVIASLSLISARTGNDNLCSEAEQQAMFEFPHYGGAEPDWESNAGTIGGCSTNYVVDAAPGEVHDYYQEGLRQRGWTVKGSANPFAMSFDAEGNGLWSSLRFESADSLDPLQEENAAAREQLRDEINCPDCSPLKPGQTRVSIAGGARR